MRNISKLILNDGRPDSIAQAIAWGQKGLDIVTAARQSCKNKSDCDTIYILLSYHLGWLYSVSFFFCGFYFFSFLFVTAFIYIFR